MEIKTRWLPETEAVNGMDEALGILWMQVEHHTGRVDLTTRIADVVALTEVPSHFDDRQVEARAVEFVRAGCRLMADVVRELPHQVLDRFSVRPICPAANCGETPDEW